MLLLRFIQVAHAALLFVVLPLFMVSCIVALKNRKRTLAVAFGSGGVLAFALYASFGFESYCYIYPSIDTRYAHGFSEQKFAQVRTGMSMEDVVSLLGEPYHNSPGRNYVRWSYTQDGKCSWADWAWLGREVIFQDGRVVERISRVYYD